MNREELRLLKVRRQGMILSSYMRNDRLIRIRARIVREYPSSSIKYTVRHGISLYRGGGMVALWRKLYYYEEPEKR